MLSLFLFIAAVCAQNEFAWSNQNLINIRTNLPNRCLIRVPMPGAVSIKTPLVFFAKLCNETTSSELAANKFNFNGLSYFTTVNDGLYMSRSNVNITPASSYIVSTSNFANSTQMLQMAGFSYIEDTRLRKWGDSTYGCVGESSKLPGYVVWWIGDTASLIYQGKCMRFVHQ